LTINISSVNISYSAELSQIAGALKIPAKAMLLDHRSAGGFFLEIIFIKKLGI